MEEFSFETWKLSNWRYSLPLLLFVSFSGCFSSQDARPIRLQEKWERDFLEQEKY